MKYTVNHQTVYQYGSTVVSGQNEARLLPRDTEWQTCRHCWIDVQPAATVATEREDFFGNRVHYIAVQDIHQAFEVNAYSEVDVNARAISEKTVSRAWQEVRRTLQEAPDATVLDARQFVLASPFVSRSSELQSYAEMSFAPGRSLTEATRDLTTRIFREFTYDPQFTTVATPLREVFESRRGVCQDFAHLAIACVRAMGLAARYVSGYLETLPPPGQPRLEGADASHAWFAVYVPEYGWAEYDPTNDCMPGEQHITVAWGRDYGDVVPLKGVMIGGGEHELEVRVDVVRRDATD
jgi:transglutaminase-like putative cysteine protease